MRPIRGPQSLSGDNKVAFSREELILGGLVKPKDENNPRARCYDRFRHRLMFPITNDLGEVIAFSGPTD